MYQMQPNPNLARRYQIFQLWVRPVQPNTAKFALRLALYELSQLIKNGLSESSFEMTRDFVAKNTNLLESTQSAQLGFAIDGMYYDRPEFSRTFKLDLAKVTLADVNRVIRRYLRTDHLVIVAVGKNGEELKQQLASDDPSPMTYNSPKPASITDVDKIVESWPLQLKADNIKVVAVDQVFQ
jgi:zinc protease